MLFNSLSFIVFFVFTLLVFRIIPSWKGKKFFLLIMSYFFYASWNPPFLLLLFFSTMADWFFVKVIHRSTTESQRRFWLIVSLTINLGLLGFFKYSNFIIENFRVLAGALHIPFNPVTWNIILPLGISFYTFHTLSYVFDVYRRKIRPWSSFVDYCLYVAFFPALVAGPIVRASDFLPQCPREKKVSLNKFSWGMLMFFFGLFQKMVLADYFMAPVANRAYVEHQSIGFLDAWGGTLAFSVQIYCDFAGYSMCAIGLALCFGFGLRRNFHTPYASIGFSDFWRRWHISLSSWLRDYLYIPLGGNRFGAARTYINLMLTMLIGGLWHGASWTFVVWGGLHGLYLCVERFFNLRNTAQVTKPGFSGTLIILLTYFLTCLTWVFFRARDFPQAWMFIASMFGFSDGQPLFHLLEKKDLVIVLLLTVAVLFSQFIFRSRSLKHAVERMPWWLLSLVTSLMVLFILSTAGEENAFIYFQF
jgi:alginate O-acetyltransferase complex protein AlgI